VFSSCRQHLKDIINLRRTDGELLRRLPKDCGGSGMLFNVERDGALADIDTEPVPMLSRQKCIPVVRGLVTLLLSMDFTCHVDLFIVACKVCIINNLQLFIYIYFYIISQRKYIAINANNKQKSLYA